MTVSYIIAAACECLGFKEDKLDDERKGVTDEEKQRLLDKVYNCVLGLE
jgi:hypothetical protein